MNSDRFSTERILSVHFWTPGLVSFRLSRPAGYRFIAGQFARLGLARSHLLGAPRAAAEDAPRDTRDDKAADDIVWRAYSIASAPSAEYLEFCSVLLPEGEFTRPLAALRPGDAIYLEQTSYGFLTTAGFAPGKDLWMVATGTGLAPFVSMTLEPTTWEAYENLVVVHSVRDTPELTYRDTFEALATKPVFGAHGTRLRYVPIVTRGATDVVLRERIPLLLADGRLEHAAGLALNLERSRVLLCGNPAMVSEVRAALKPLGYLTSRRDRPGTLAVENYW